MYMTQVECFRFLAVFVGVELIVLKSDCHLFTRVYNNTMLLLLFYYRKLHNGLMGVIKVYIQ